ncbi:MAG: alginate lyase family protein [Pricia sp.]
MCPSAPEDDDNSSKDSGLMITAPTQKKLGSLTYFDSKKLAIVKSEIEKKNPKYRLAYEKLLKSAEIKLAEGPYSVMQKSRTPPSGDKHDYLSLAPYWWPDPDKSDGLPWIRRDGEVNPMTKGSNVDDPVKDDFFSSLESLSWAFYFAKNSKYADKIVELLETFFLNPATRMNPNLNFAQGVPGKSEGRGFGIIEFAGISRVVTAIEILEAGDAIPQEKAQALRDWLSDYLQWLQTSELGIFEKERLNNHGTMYDVQEVGLLLFLHREAEAKAVLETVKTQRIAPHIMADGTQPEELKRTKSLSYSILNLSGLTQLAYFGQRLGVDLWNYKPPKNGGIQQAYDFLYPYALEKKKWKRQQLGNLKGQVIRLQRMFIRAGSLFDNEEYCSILEKFEDIDDLDLLIYPCLP